jgi:acetyl-CoA carboxylase biotin carboxyl carrier protein
MNLKEIKELMDLITEKGISEFELERAGVRLKISRPTDGTRPTPVVTQVSESRAAIAPGAPPPPAPVVRTPAPPPPAAAAPQSEDLHVVRSPMVGTFYSAPSQGAPPFVQVGDRIEVGQVLCIIEAMKLMNEIESEIAGEVLRCYVESGQPVEYGEPLFDLRPGKRA